MPVMSAESQCHHRKMVGPAGLHVPVFSRLRMPAGDTGVQTPVTPVSLPLQDVRCRSYGQVLPRPQKL